MVTGSGLFRPVAESMKQQVKTLALSRPARSGSREQQDQTVVGTELVTFENKSGKRLVGFHDYPVGLSDQSKWMIVLPGYGETKTDVLSESYFLAKNGFQTLRFDYTDHVGESDGDIYQTTLSKMKDDIKCSLDYLCHRFHPTSVGAVASSLSARAMLRASREDHRISLLLNIVAVVDLRKTLFAIYQEDYLKRVERGLHVDAMDVLGFQVDAESFLRSAIEDCYEDLETTMEDLRHIDAPSVFFAAEKDAWVELADVRRAVYATPGKRKDLHIFDGAMHELHENPSVSRELLRQIVRYATFFLLDPGQTENIKAPNLREIGFRIRREKKRNKIIHAVSKREELDFWKSYLDNYSFVVNVPDYWDLLNLIHYLLEECKPKDRILDAGCGIGNYGTFLLVRLLYQGRQQPMYPPEYQSLYYTGIDFVREAIEHAIRTQSRIEAEFTRSMTATRNEKLLVRSYYVADLESPLAFKDNSFDKVCCNLVVSYLENPAEAVSEMVRVLKPEGKIVITSLKPFADLSQVYRNFVKVTKGRKDREEARKLLSNAGRIKAKEVEGVYEFFSEEALTDLLKNVGVHDIETYRSLGNQANVAVGLKK
jgi:SAM-dependent methyltransferase/pimeloyl-ACP methyl ester carboxylesterase